MGAIEVSGEVMTALLVATVPVGAALLGWIVKQMRATAEINARIAQRLAHLEDRLERLEGVVWRPAWGTGPLPSSGTLPPSGGTLP